MSQPIRMVGVDFDLTLIEDRNGRPYLPPDTYEMLIALIDSGTEVGIVTGRGAWAVHKLLEQAGITWGQPFPTFICPREVFLYWITDGKLQPDQVWNQARSKDIASLVSWITPRQYEWHRTIEAAGLEIAHWILWGDYGLEIGMNSPEEAEHTRQMLSGWVQDMPLARVHRNHALAHVVIATGGKGNALLHAASERSLAPEQVLAIGDSLNDLQMLDGKLGMHGGAVGNADPAVKQAVEAAGGVVATQPASRGIGEILRHYRQEGLLG